MAKKGFIAVCRDWTEKECFDKMLFGSAPDWFDRVSQVHKGDIGFLMNIESDVLFGIFRAESDGQMNIDSAAWRGYFPAQVRVSWEKQFEPVRNAQALLRGLGIRHGRYVLTSQETLPVRSLFEEPEDVALVTVQPSLTRPEPQQPRFKTEDGHYVRSKSESLIDNWLYNHSLVHAYERRVPIPEELMCDFYVLPAKSYIEYWGLEEDEGYLKRKEQKIRLYNKHGLKLIELREADIERIDDVMGKYFGGYVPK